MTLSLSLSLFRLVFLLSMVGEPHIRHQPVFQSTTETFFSNNKKRKRDKVTCHVITEEEFACGACRFGVCLPYV